MNPLPKKHFWYDPGLQPLCHQKGKADLQGSIKGTTCGNCKAILASNRRKDEKYAKERQERFRKAMLKAVKP